MNPAPDSPTPLSWCGDCRKYVDQHPLIHQINSHAPRMGTRRTGYQSWRTAELQVRS